MSEGRIYNYFPYNIFTIPCDECYSINNHFENKLEDHNNFSQQSILLSLENNNDSIINNFNFTTFLKKNWKNKARKLLYKSRNKIKKMIKEIILRSQN